MSIRTTGLQIAACVLGLVACTSRGVDVPPCERGPGTICTVAGSGLTSVALYGDGGPAIAATLYTPQDTVVGPDGTLFILDFNDYTVRTVDAAGMIHTVVGTGILGDSPDPGETRCPALEASLNHLSTLALHDGYLYLAAWHNSRVKRLRLADMTVENFAGRGKRTLYTGDDGPALDAALDLPSGLAIAPNGDVAVMDQENQVIRRVDSDGNIHRLAGQCVVEWSDLSYEPCARGPTLQQCPGSDKTTYCSDLEAACAMLCTPGFSGDGGPALSLRMSQPFSEAADPSGRMIYDESGALFFADTGNHRIRKIGADGIVTTVAGTGEAGYGGDGGPATAAQLDHPVDLALDDGGVIYVADTYNDCVRKIDGGVITTVAGRCRPGGCDRAGEECFSGDGGPATEAQLNRPYGIDVARGKLYISDSYNDRIRMVSL